MVINDIFDFFKLEVGKVSWEFGFMDFKCIVEEVVVLLEF